MRKRNGVCIADEGKRFVLTEEGKNNCKKYLHKTVGEPVDIYETEALERDVVNGYVKETVDPEWIDAIYKGKNFSLVKKLQGKCIMGPGILGLMHFSLVIML